MTEIYTPSEPVPFVPVLPEPKTVTVERIVYQDRPAPPSPLYRVNVKEQFWEHVTPDQVIDRLIKLRAAGVSYFEVVRQ